MIENKPCHISRSKYATFDLFVGKICFSAVLDGNNSNGMRQEQEEIYYSKTQTQIYLQSALNRSFLTAS